VFEFRRQSPTSKKPTASPSTTCIATPVWASRPEPGTAPPAAATPNVSWFAARSWHCFAWPLRSWVH